MQFHVFPSPCADFHELMLEDIRQRVEESVADETLLHTRFHLAFVNVWSLSASPTPDDDELFPAEIAIIEFTLNEGILRIFHQLVDPEDTQLGFKGEFKIYSEKYHKLWMDNPEMCNDHGDILAVIKKMLTAKAGERPAGANVKVSGFENIADLIRCYKLIREPYGETFLPIYAMPRQVEISKKAFKWLSSQNEVIQVSCAGTGSRDAVCLIRFFVMQEPLAFDFYELPHLFMALLGAVKTKSFIREVPTVNIAEAHLDRDVFLYTPGLSCKYAPECTS